MIMKRKYCYESKVRSKKVRFLCGLLTAGYCACVFGPLGVCFSKAEQIPYSLAECVMEADSRRILFERNGEEELPMASTTKILTAITVLENCRDVTEEFPIPEEAVGIEGSSVYLQSGELYSCEDLLYGLMLRSGNDCAEALALHTSGSLESFALRMNETAHKAGALHSSFKNPHGLPCEGHYTTARDLNLITCYAMHNNFFKKLVSMRYYEHRNWSNKNKMLKNYEGAIGVKTGFTKQAGRCLVSAAERGGMTLVCTVLNSPRMYERSANLLDDAFESYEHVRILGADTPVQIEEKGEIWQGVTREDLYYPLLPEEKLLLNMQIQPKSNALKSEKNGEIIGEVKIYLINRLLFSKNLYKL